MVSPFVCKVCGGSITLGRHGSGWRHQSGEHIDHKVQKISREEYRQLVGKEEDTEAGDYPERIEPA